jgi:ABC-type dipeptide transport system, periplasmic component
MPKVMPFLAQDVYSRRITDQIFEGLGDYDPQTLSIRGVLAEAWQYDPDGMWLRVKIRDNARFSDGVPVTADDVVFTWKDFILNPQLETERARSISDNVSDVVALSEKVVEFTFKTPLYSNLTVALVTEVTPKHFYSSFKPEQINSATSLLLGSGPYKAANTNPNNQWTPGEPFVLVRNESYWGPARGTLDSLRYIVITDDTSALVSYKNGDADMMRPSSSQFVQSQETDPDWDAKHHSLNWINMRSGYSFIGWQCGPRNGKLTPFHDRRVRLAMTHLLDRWRIIREITEGIGEVATGPNNSASPASNPDVTPWPYDLDTARRLLAEAGWADTDSDGILENAAGEEFDFEFTYSRGSEAVERIANYLKDQCALVGIRCTLRTVDWSIYVDILNKRDFDAITMGWSASAPESDPQQIWHSRSIENQGDNFIQWANADADRLIDAGRAELDEAKRMKIWQDLHRVMHEDQPYTFVREAPWLRFISQEFQNIHAYPKGLEQKEFYAVPTPGV